LNKSRVTAAASVRIVPSSSDGRIYEEDPGPMSYPLYTSR
jgi:hypothetical protein